MFEGWYSLEGAIMDADNATKSLPSGLACPRLGKIFNCCEWESIYDTVNPSPELARFIELAFQLPQNIAKLGVKRSTYVGALCRTCGKFVARD
jgi:hypothetical protein